MSFTGKEGTPGKAGTNPLGGNFIFNTSGSGTYVITIDVNKNGVFTDPVDRKLTGAVNAGTDTIYWDGLDGLGNKVPADTVTGYNAGITITATAGEVHFPFFDVERNVNGIKLTRLNGNNAPDNIVYWDDTPITIVGTPPNPIKNLTGINSLVNGHKWGTPTTDPDNDQDFGNNKGIDTWAYISSAPLNNSVSFKLLEADLEIDSVRSVAGCAGQPVNYMVTVRNNGPDDVAGAKFSFTFPDGITNVTVSSAATTGISATSAGNVSANAYTANIDMANGSVITFNINALIAQTATGSLVVTAAILRPADVTDPDATNPDAAPPTDPIAECNSLPSGPGCNNVKTNITAYEPAPNEGPDQTVYQYVTAMVSAMGLGTWSQAVGNPSFANIADPASSSTKISRFKCFGGLSLYIYQPGRMYLYRCPNGYFNRYSDTEYFYTK